MEKVPRLNPDKNPLAKAVLDAEAAGSVDLVADASTITAVNNLLAVLRHPLHNKKIKKITFHLEKKATLSDRFFSEEIVGKVVVDSLAFHRVSIPGEFFYRVRFEGIRELRVVGGYGGKTGNVRDWVNAMGQAPAAATLRTIELYHLPCPSFRVSLAPFTSLVSLTIEGRDVPEKALEHLVEVVVPTVPPSLTMIVLGSLDSHNLSPLDRLARRPISRPVRLEVEDWPVTINGTSKRSVPALTIRLRGWSLKPHHLPPLVIRESMSTLAAEGKLSFEALPEGFVMDEHALDIIVEQGVRFPRFVPRVQIPLALLGQAPRVVRAGKPLNLEISVRAGTKKVDDAELEALGSAVRLAARDVKVDFRGHKERYSEERFPACITDRTAGQLVRPIFSGGPFDLLSLSSLFVKVSDIHFLKWSRDNGSLTITGVPAGCLDVVAASLFARGDPALGSINVTVLADDLDTLQVQGLLRAMLVLPERASLRVGFNSAQSKFNPAPVCSAWAAMIDAGAVRRCQVLRVSGRLAWSLGGDMAEVEGGGPGDLALVGELLNNLRSTFGAREFRISNLRAHSRTAMEEQGGAWAADLQGLGKALCQADSVRVHLESGSPSEDASFEPILFDRIVDPLIQGWADGLLGKSGLSFRLGYATLFDWGGGRYLTAAPPSAASLRNFALTFSRVPLSSVCLRFNRGGDFDLRGSPLPALLLGVEGGIDVSGLDVPSMVAAWHELIASGSASRLTRLKIVDAVLDFSVTGEEGCGGGGGAPAFLASAFKKVEIEVKDSVPAYIRPASRDQQLRHLARLAMALAGVHDLNAGTPEGEDPSGRVLSLLARPFLPGDGAASFHSKVSVSIAVQDARFEWESTGSRRLKMKGLLAEDLGRALRMIKDSSLSVQSLAVSLCHIDDLREVADLFSEVVVQAAQVELDCPGLDVNAQLVSWRQKVKLPVPQGWRWSLRGSVALTLMELSCSVDVALPAGLRGLPDLFSTLCNSYGVTNLDIEVHPQYLESLADLARLISSMPLTSLTVSGFPPDWAVDVVRPGPGPLQHLTFKSTVSSDARQKLGALLGPNESLITVQLRPQLHYVDPANFRLLVGSRYSQDNRILREKLASLLSALPLTADDIIPSEVGLAIRRQQARTREPRWG
jgi:hypothetical protein